MRVISAFAAVAWLGAAAVTPLAEGVIDVTDPAAVAWASLSAIPAVLFILRILERASWVSRNRAATALLISEAGAFIFGLQVWSEWRTLLAQGIAVGMGAVGAEAVLTGQANGVNERRLVS